MMEKVAHTISGTVLKENITLTSRSKTSTVFCQILGYRGWRNKICPYTLFLPETSKILGGTGCRKSMGSGAGNVEKILKWVKPYMLTGIRRGDTIA
jgi:hypothetical protein